MKKILIFLGVFLCVSIMVYMVMNNIKTNPPLYHNITLQDYKNKVESKETFYMYIYANSCEVCQQFKPVVNDFLEKSRTKFYAINLDIQENNNPEYLMQQKVSKTPTLIFYKNGKESSRSVGYITTKDLKHFVEENN
ncbi:thioredoxin family protein [Paenibacillus sp. WLX2291]|uniref:thioredoxin family protein n=1 Tax=Paenibacillus sp. WLX2291 TaxID=3296934 RepID=UPI003983DCE5